LAALAAIAAAAPAWAQTPSQVDFADGSAISLSPDRTVATFRAQGQERSITTKSAYFRLDAVRDARGAVVGAALVENWADHWTVTIYAVSSESVETLVALSSPSPTVAISDWDNDGDLDVGVPDAVGLPALFLESPTDVVVYEQNGEQVYRSSASCFPAFATYMRNAAASVEGTYRTLSALSQPMTFGASQLTPGEMVSIPTFIGQIQQSLAKPCERVAVNRFSP
jgi:hypothetical protein